MGTTPHPSPLPFQGRGGRINERDGADKVDEFAEAMFVETGSGVVFWQDTFEALVVALDRDHRVVDDLPNG